MANHPAIISLVTKKDKLHSTSESMKVSEEKTSNFQNEELQFTPPSNSNFNIRKSDFLYKKIK